MHQQYLFNLKKSKLQLIIFGYANQIRTREKQYYQINKRPLIISGQFFDIRNLTQKDNNDPRAEECYYG